jgi:futalosine hydrolase
MTKATARTATSENGRWLILAAWRPELACLRASLPKLPGQVRRRIALASAGVGLVEAAIGATRLLVEHKPAAVMLVGSAGVYPGSHPELALGGAAIVDGIRLLPEILPGKHAFLPTLMPARARSTPALVRTMRRATHLPTADVACPLAITASTRAAQAAARLSGCALENLEAFAIARAAAAMGIPFAAVLGVANHVGPDGHREWKQNGRKAAAAACEAVVKYLTALVGEVGAQRGKRTQSEK